MFLVLGVWYSNAWGTGHLPLNSNRVYDHFGHLYNVSRAIHRKSGLFDAEKYEKYSPAFLASGNITIYIFYFSIYSATLVYAVLYQRHEIQRGFADLLGSFWKSKKRPAQRHHDIHNHLMSAYKDGELLPFHSKFCLLTWGFLLKLVPEWWFVLVFVFAVVCGIIGVTVWPTYTSPGVVFFGLALCIIFVVPIGVIKSTTGVEVNLSILAEFIGGSMVPGNALAMNYMKAFGQVDLSTYSSEPDHTDTIICCRYVTCNHAINFSNDLKLAHYVKVGHPFYIW